MRSDEEKKKMKIDVRGAEERTVSKGGKKGSVTPTTRKNNARWKRAKEKKKENGFKGKETGESREWRCSKPEGHAIAWRESDSECAIGPQDALDSFSASVFQEMKRHRETGGGESGGEKGGEREGHCAEASGGGVAVHRIPLSRGAHTIVSGADRPKATVGRVCSRGGFCSSR